MSQGPLAEHQGFLAIRSSFLESRGILYRPMDDISVDYSQSHEFLLCHPCASFSNTTLFIIMQHHFTEICCLLIFIIMMPFSFEGGMFPSFEKRNFDFGAVILSLGKGFPSFAGMEFCFWKSNSSFRKVFPLFQKGISC